MIRNAPFISAMVIPTGVGASIGGFAGDAALEMNLLAAVSDILITHPNVANAAAMQNLPDNVLYVEGYALDRFFEGLLALQPVRNNRIGVVFDSGIEERMLTLHRNTLHAVQTVHGVEIIGYTLTETPLEIRCGFDPSGSSTGSLGNPEVLLNACCSLIDQGATALALACCMPEIAGEAAYKQGEGVDPVGGIEAILSHLVVTTFGVPCAHAPVFHEADAMPEMRQVLDPRTAAEFITPTFLPSVLTGLNRAPQFVPPDLPLPANAITVAQLSALVIPGNALGGIPVLAALEGTIPVIAVAENKTVMNVTPKDLGDPPGLFEAATYYEAAGMLTALREGLPVPFPRSRKIPELTRLKAFSGKIPEKADV